MNSKLLSFLLILCCAALLGLKTLQAQSPAAGSDGNGNSVTAPSQSSGQKNDVAPAARERSTPNRSDDSKSSADDAIANDRGTSPANNTRYTRIHPGWLALIGVVGMTGLFFLLRRASDKRKTRIQVRDLEPPVSYKRAA